MDLRKFIRESKSPVAFLQVTDSKGSSPGRKGFNMAIRKTGEMCGSIGGGIMEQNLVHWALDRLRTGQLEPASRKQIHRPGEGTDYSGLICSGEQTVSLSFIDPASDVEIHFERRATVYIIGGGHVGLALSRVMSQLDFRVEIFDDRSDLNTIENNHFADKKHVGNLDKTLSNIPDGPDIYVVAVTFGIAIDRIVLNHLLKRDFRYFGLMGSEAKLGKLKKEFGPLNGISAPIGLPINSHTPEEIAVSIAAEIIEVKNSVP